MKELGFKFDLDQRVKTFFDEVGIVRMLGYDDSGKLYHVKTKESSVWYKEAELELAK